MNSSDYGEFQSGMQRLGRHLVLPRDVKADFEIIVEEMFEALAPYPLGLVKKAIRQFSSGEYQFFPKIYDLRRVMDRHLAEEAWDFVGKLCDKWGSEYGIRFTYPVIHYAIGGMGGWVALCDKRDDSSNYQLKMDFMEKFIEGAPIASWLDEPGKVKVQPFLQGKIRWTIEGKAYMGKIFDVSSGMLVDASNFSTNKPIKKLSEPQIEITPDMWANLQLALSGGGGKGGSVIG